MRARVPISIAVALVVTAVAPTTASARVDEVNTKRLRDGVTVGGILAHERVFQRIANNNGGTRASGTSGYDQSAEYVAARLERAGYDVSTQEFTFPFFRDLSPAELQQVTPTLTDYETASFTYSGAGDVTGALVPTLDVVIPPGATPGSTSGCEAEDFVPAAADVAQIALIQRGTCTFAVKVANAVAAGYDAVVIFNEGQPGRDVLLQGTLGGPVAVPVVGLDFASAADLYAATQAGEVVVRVFADTESDLEAVTTNVIAETPGGDPEKVIVVGAHLDSVIEGPGINDNGSGSATILEIAEEISELPAQPRQKIRFAFWGAEELGLLGSEYYVGNLPDDELGNIAANLNFDMLGSPNYVRFIYDGDGSDTAIAGPPGSAQIESVFTDYFSGQGLASEPTEFSGRSDYGPFIAVGIPAGGLFSGAEGIKTEEEAAVYGGTAGVAYDACYHQACDTINNVNTKALAEMGDAAAHATWTLARSRSGFFEDGSLRVAGTQRVASSGGAALEGHAATS